MVITADIRPWHRHPPRDACSWKGLAVFRFTQISHVVPTHPELKNQRSGGSLSELYISLVKTFLAALVRAVTARPSSSSQIRLPVAGVLPDIRCEGSRYLFYSPHPQCDHAVQPGLETRSQTPTGSATMQSTRKDGTDGRSETAANANPA